MRGREDPYLKVGRSNDRATKGDSDYVYAIKDISFEVNQGEVLGIIGRNGAGKSTLLKILSRVTTPTSGRIKVKGRIASLLEVGTGFHPELTGRENIYLNGAILGMRKAEIRAKFDKIVDFSGCERYIDTPVKRYSSGMYVRLAFAVAAHLETEILIIDEVLAVGDQEFQQKCLGKMQDVSRDGKTVLFVSHNMNAVTMLCKKAVVLQNGGIAFHGGIGQALSHYGATSEVSGEIKFDQKNTNSCLRSVAILQNDLLSDGNLKVLAEIALNFYIHTKTSLAKPRLGASITNSKGDRVFSVASWLGPTALEAIHGDTIVQIKFTMPPLAPGKYTLDFGFYENHSEVFEEHYSAGAIEICETNYLQTVEPYQSEIGHLFVRSTCTMQ